MFKTLWLLILPLTLFARGAHHTYVTLEGDFIYIRRAHSNQVALAESVEFAPIPPIIIPPQDVKTPNRTLLRTNSLVDDMSFEPGLRASLKANQGDYGTYELRYTGLLNWEGREPVRSTNSIAIPGKLAIQTTDYKNASSARAIYTSRFWSLEANYWGRSTPRYVNPFSVSWVLGLRYLSINERLKLFYTTGKSTSPYRVRTVDHAFGPQFGFSLEYNPYEVLTWGLHARGGILFNRGWQQTRFADKNNTVTLIHYNINGSNFAYMVEGYPYIEFLPIPELTITISYNFLYVGNVVVADRQFNFNNLEKKLNHHGGPMYHGLTAGLSFNF